MSKTTKTQIFFKVYSPFPMFPLVSNIVSLLFYYVKPL